MDALEGLLIELAGLLLLGGGFFAGWKVRGAREPSADNPDRQEIQRAAAEQDAFKKMMDYSVETAYGLNRGERIDS